jgi:hypothetical protein
MAIPPRPALPVAEAGRRLSPDVLDSLRDVLWHDMVSEYDARHLSRFYREAGPPLSDAFFAVEADWAGDEDYHFQGFLAVNRFLFGFDEDELAERGCDFAPMAHLLEDEFSLCVLGAYDEAATVFAYQAYAPLYAHLGPEFMAFMRRVIADEGRHYHSFLVLARDGFPERVGECEAVLDRIQACETGEYRGTFLLDHDDPVFGEEIFARARALVRRALRPAVHRDSGPERRACDNGVAQDR